MWNSIFGRLLTSYIGVIALTLITVSILLSQMFANYYFSSKEREIIAKGQEIAYALTDIFEQQRFYTVDPWLRLVDRSLGARVLVVDKRGLVLASSVQDRRGAGKGFYLNPEERESIFAGEIVSRREFTDRFNRTMLFVAVPIQVNNQVAGAVLLYSPVSDMMAAVSGVRKLMLYAACISVLVAVAVGYFLSRSLSRPLRRMGRAAMEMARGNYKQQIKVTSGDELGKLAQNFNNLAASLEEAVSELSREKSKLENIIKNMAEGVLAKDTGGEILFANAEAERIAELIKKYSGTEEEQELAELFSEVCRIKQPLTKEFCLGEGEFYFLARVVPLPGEKGGVYGAVGVLQDVTELRKLEQMRREFVANVSHELRTPLTSIQAFTEAIRDGMAVQENTRQEYLDIIHEEVVRLNRLIHNLLELSLLEAGKASWKKAPVNLRDLISQAVLQLSPGIEEKNLQINLHISEDLPRPEADADRIREVLLNLISNAVRFTPAGGEIEVSARLMEKEIMVSIKDTGEGIPEKELPHIWDRFYRVEKSRARSRGGTGLGLAIVKQIVEAYGGRVLVESRVGEGSVFSFTLPLSSSHPEEKNSGLNEHSSRPPKKI